MTDAHATSDQLHPISRARLEMLFDGIFAIAMTILVLELKVPEELADRRSVAELAHALAHSAATFGSYLLSFAMLGMLWYRHNVFYRHLRHVTRGMLVLHFVQLAMAAFFPFCAAMLGRYPANSLPLVFYAGCIMLYVWAMLATWLLAHRVGAINPQLDAAGYAAIRTRIVRSCIIITVLFAGAVARVVLG
jgi:uncharacterized membrane protein